MGKVTDRRNQALGGQRNQRSLSIITDIGVHWSGVANGTIEGHERHWENTNKWGVGGYHYAITKDGTILWNYNLERITNGVGGHNSTSAHVMYEGGHGAPMNDAQKKALKYVINELMKPKLPNLKRVRGHNEFPDTAKYKHSTNSCPGINMNDFRAYLNDGSVNVSTPSKSAPSKPIEQLAREVIDGKHGTGEARKKALGNQYNAVQKRVNEILGAKPKLAPKPSKSIETLAREVIDGKHGAGSARKQSLGTQYQAVQNRVNQILNARGRTTKSIDQLAREVIDGKWGNDPERSRKLRSAGYDANAVQRRVNQLI